MKSKHYLVDVDQVNTNTQLASLILLTEQQITMILLAGHKVFNYSESLGLEAHFAYEKSIEHRIRESLI